MSRPAKLIFFLSLFFTALTVGIVLRGRFDSVKRAEPKYARRPKGTLTFNKDIAPILFKQCAGCHRPGQSAPFALLTYADVKKRAKEIAEVTSKRLMPPWMPEPGYGDFLDARLLSAEEIGQIGQWASEGTPEGEAKDLPATPQWPEGWQLGAPDLVVGLPEPYTLKAEGRDVYRNFVIPVPLTNAHYVRAIEFNPGNPRVVHHAFIRFDRTAQSRRLDQKDPEAGFGGIHTPETALPPDGHFLSWQPGKVPSKGNAQLAWTLGKGSDLVLQVHMQPTGKAETIQPAVGFYFADKPATNAPLKIGMGSYAIDIPAGTKDYVVNDTYELPVDVDVLAVLPHAHYLGKEMRGYALLPDGTKRWLLLIKNWDFNWQGDYRYAHPVSLPKGTKLMMEFVYDNSADNERNPNHPPKRVQYGLQSSDEMAELWFQMLPHHAADAKIFSEKYQQRVVQDVIAYNEYLLRQDAKDVKAHTKLAKAFLSLGKSSEALRHLHAAAAIDINDPDIHYFLGIVYRQQSRLREAKAEFENAIRLEPENNKAHGNLGLVLLSQGNLDEAAVHFQHALRIDPEDTVARECLADIAKAKAESKNSR